MKLCKIGTTYDAITMLQKGLITYIEYTVTHLGAKKATIAIDRNMGANRPQEILVHVKESASPKYAQNDRYACPAHDGKMVKRIVAEIAAASAGSSSHGRIVKVNDTPEIRQRFGLAEA